MLKNLFGKSDRELAFDSIIEFINASSYEEKKKFIQNHQILLSSDARFVLDKMIAHDAEKHDEDSVRFLKFHKQLLTRCQQIGINQAFKEFDLMLLQNVIRDLVGAENADQAREVIFESPEVLTDEAIRLIDELIENQDDEGTKNILNHRRTLILRCRELGIDTAFEKDKLEQQKRNPLILALLGRLLETESLLEKKLVILDHPDLLSDESLEFIRYIIDDTSERGVSIMGEYHDVNKAQLKAYLELLTMCKEKGVKTVFQEMEFAILYKTYGEKVQSIIEKINLRSVINVNASQAIAQFYELLKYVNKNETPQTWGVAQIGLATALAQNPHGNKSQNLEESISHYLQALEVIKRDYEPDGWAETIENLANTYTKRIQGDTAENIEIAIRYYQQALEVFTKDAYPKDWAVALRNLTVAISQRKYGDPVENIEITIRYCEQIRQVSTFEDSLEDWVLNQNSLGLAYFNRKKGNRASNLEKSIEYFEEILDNLAEDELPELWGTVQHNLANSYSLRILGEKSENIEKSIHHYEQALSVRTKKSYPEKWAMTNHDLATTYLDRIVGNPQDNRRKAMKYLSLTLEINTSDQYPIECRETAVKLGTLAFEDKNWDVCIEAYEQVLSAHMVVLQNLIGNRRKTNELKEVRNIHQNLAYAYIKIENIEKAVEILEDGRATLLREAIERQRNDLNRLNDLGFEDLYSEYQESTTK